MTQVWTQEQIRVWEESLTIPIFGNIEAASDRARVATLLNKINSLASNPTDPWDTVAIATTRMENVFYLLGIMQSTKQYVIWTLVTTGPQTYHRDGNVRRPNYLDIKTTEEEALALMLIEAGSFWPQTLKTDNSLVS